MIVIPTVQGLGLESLLQWARSLTAVLSDKFQAERPTEYVLAETATAVSKGDKIPGGDLTVVDLTGSPTVDNVTGKWQAMQTLGIGGQGLFQKVG